MASKESGLRGAATQRQYIKFKFKKFKKEMKRGNRAAAERHATELTQFLGFENNEIPIESAAEQVGLPHRTETSDSE